MDDIVLHVKDISFHIKNADNIPVIYIKDKNKNIVAQCLVDEHVWSIVNKYSWSRSHDYYKSKVNLEYLYLHNFIYEAFVGPIPEGYTVDHVNSENKHDHRLSNLRLLNPSEQAHNRRKIKIDSSSCKYKGACLYGNKFMCYVDRKYLGAYNTEEEAALKYNEYCLNKYGNNASLNIITTANTTVANRLKDKDITIEYVENIKTVCGLKDLVRRKGWGGNNGLIKITRIRGNTFEKFKEMAINILKKELGEKDN